MWWWALEGKGTYRDGERSPRQLEICQMDQNLLFSSEEERSMFLSEGDKQRDDFHVQTASHPRKRFFFLPYRPAGSTDRFRSDRKVNMYFLGVAPVKRVLTTTVLHTLCHIIVDYSVSDDVALDKTRQFRLSRWRTDFLTDKQKRITKLSLHKSDFTSLTWSPWKRKYYEFIADIHHLASLSYTRHTRQVIWGREGEKTWRHGIRNMEWILREGKTQRSLSIDEDVLQFSLQFFSWLSSLLSLSDSLNAPNDKPSQNQVTWLSESKQPEGELMSRKEKRTDRHSLPSVIMTIRHEESFVRGMEAYLSISVSQYLRGRTDDETIRRKGTGQVEDMTDDGRIYCLSFLQFLSHLQWIQLTFSLDPLSYF